ncbi:copper resistance protein NlpE N-terminal domain-containing protein [Psychrobacter okhotskensis]|uniref:copper resistance protein NlpE N-terminal domain-containing protein n=1 Tax=Psychrobacter okhotskensis TaxID=212403 RepID=UPI00191AF122|nr:copper resistance protein NlpE N-terminal domain-containing protein [Psychrobacter okhotskensis]
MIYLTSIFSTSSNIIRRARRPLLAVPICLLLIGCDSSSSTTNKSISTKVAPVDNTENAALQDAAQDNQQTDTDISANADTGQSLINAAQPDDDTHTRHSPMISEPNNNSALQATLMGDYGGMVPCASCDNIDITLNLFADGSVLKTSLYNSAEPPRQPLLESGIYRQDNDTITIVYESKHIETYHIQDNHLVMMDEYKNPNGDYTLSRR